MIGRLTTPYHDMPGEQLTRDVQSRAILVAGVDPYDTQLRGAGYFLRTYVGLFNGSGPLRQEDALDRLPEQSQTALMKVADACLSSLILTGQADKDPFYLSEPRIQ